MSKLGVIECYFGPAWSEPCRRSYARFLGENGFGLYIYAPKADSLLRKAWMDPWPEPYLQALRDRATVFQREGVRFGVGLSPFGLMEGLTGERLGILDRKVELLHSLGIDQLTILFDDMPSESDLASKQIRVMERVRKLSPLPLAFCPSYYSPDPVLDKVFGARPPGYLEEIGRGVPADIEILWTGPKVISPEIPEDHLQETAHLLRRKPFLCDNLFANDGPKNCKRLRLATPLTRTGRQVELSSHWCFNPMNQAELSKLLLRAVEQVISGATEPEQALNQVCEATCSPALATIIRENRQGFLDAGLDGISDVKKTELISHLVPLATHEPPAQEILAWLRDEYAVGAECLTD